jgi:chloramphenicol 3-O-phosphotransferase
MLDKPEKTRDLIAILEAALPFEVALMPALIERLARHLRSPELKRLATSDVYWDRIISIEPCCEQETYDLEVDTSRATPLECATLIRQKFGL